MSMLTTMLPAVGGGNGLVFNGVWNANTNTPTLTSGVGEAGHYYIVTVAGTTDLDGITSWEVNDWAVFNGTAWQKVEGGAISLNWGNIDGTLSNQTDLQNALNAKLNSSGGTVGQLIVGDPGSESNGINVNGTTFQSTAKVSDIAGTNLAQTILHRHSTTIEPLIVGARSNSDDAGHADVSAGQSVFTVYAVGYAGNSYKIFGAISFGVDSVGTISDTSAPGRVVYSVTPDGHVIPVAYMTVGNDGKITFLADTNFNNLTGETFLFLDAGKNATAIDATTATGLLDAMVGDSGSGGTKGLVPAPSSGDAAAGKFLRADGTWALTPEYPDPFGYVGVGTGLDYASVSAAVAAGKNKIYVAESVTESSQVNLSVLDDGTPLYVMLGVGVVWQLNAAQGITGNDGTNDTTHLIEIYAQEGGRVVANPVDGSADLEINIAIGGLTAYSEVKLINCVPEITTPDERTDGGVFVDQAVKLTVDCSALSDYKDLYLANVGDTSGLFNYIGINGDWKKVNIVGGGTICSNVFKFGANGTYDIKFSGNFGTGANDPLITYAAAAYPKIENFFWDATTDTGGVIQLTGDIDYIYITDADLSPKTLKIQGRVFVEKIVMGTGVVVEFPANIFTPIIKSGNIVFKNSTTVSVANLILNDIATTCSTDLTISSKIKAVNCSFDASTKVTFSGNEINLQNCWFKKSCDITGNAAIVNGCRAYATVSGGDSTTITLTGASTNSIVVNSITDSAVVDSGTGNVTANNVVI